MSHVSKYKMRIKDIDTFKKILSAEGISYRENVRTKLYGSNQVNAEVEFQIPGWRYPCAVTIEGEILYDHYGSSSSTFNKLGNLVKEYNKELVMSKVFGFAQNWWEEEVKDGLKITVEC